MHLIGKFLLMQLLGLSCLVFIGCQAKIRVPVETAPGAVTMVEDEAEYPQTMQCPTELDLGNQRLQILLEIDGPAFLAAPQIKFMEALSRELARCKGIVLLQAGERLTQLLHLPDPIIFRNPEAIPATASYLYHLSFREGRESHYTGSTAITYIILATISGLATLSTTVGIVAASPTLFLDKRRDLLGNTIDLTILPGGTTQPIFRKRYKVQLTLAAGIFCFEDEGQKSRALEMIQQSIRNAMYQDMARLHRNFPADREGP